MEVSAEGYAQQPEKTSVLGVVSPPEVNPRVDILREAATLIEGDRQAEYGTPQVNFRRIADLWNISFAHLLGEGRKFSPTDVAVAMAQVKMARIIQTPKRDSFADAAGYIGLAYELSLETGPSPSNVSDDASTTSRD